MRRTLEGDEDAFAVLVRRYLRPALAAAWELTETREDAEDVVQDAFVRTLRGLERYDPSRPFAAWFFTIVRNTARNAAASRGARDARRGSENEDVSARSVAGDATIDHPDAMERAELRERLERAIDALPRMQRSCFRLCEAEGFSRAEVAEMLGISEATVRVHLHRARNALRVELRPWRDEAGEA